MRSMSLSNRILLVAFGAILFAGSIALLIAGLAPPKHSTRPPSVEGGAGLEISSPVEPVTTALPPVRLLEPDPFLEDDEPDRPEPRWPDAGTHALVVKIEDAQGRSLPGIPVAALGARDNGPVLGGPRVTRMDGRVRFPLDLRFEQEEQVLVVARSMPGSAVTRTLNISLDRDHDVLIAIDPGLIAEVRLVEPDGETYRGLARIRKVIVDEPMAEPLDRGGRLFELFREVTARAAREDGLWSLPGFKSGEKATIAVMASGYETVFAKVEAPEDGKRSFQVDVKLEGRAATVLVEVVAPIGFLADDTTFGAFRLGDSFVAPVGSADRPMQRDGRFRVTVPAGVAGVLRLNAFRHGRLEASREIPIPMLTPGAESDLGKIVPELLPVVVAGVVTDAEGKPVEGAAVEVIGDDESRDLAATTVANGQFEIRGAPGLGNYVVSAHLAGRVSTRVWDIAEGSRGIQLVLESAGSIGGTVVLPQESRHDRVIVRAMCDGRPVAVTAVRADGGFVVTGLPAGNYRVIVEGQTVESVRVSDVTVMSTQVTNDPRLERIMLRSKPRRE